MVQQSNLRFLLRVSIIRNIPCNFHVFQHQINYNLFLMQTKQSEAANDDNDNTQNYHAIYTFNDGGASDWAY
jgi:hypothetical protein